jgi:peptidoglycan hydrolase-like protein with peptidoglycan-binding domain
VSSRRASKTASCPAKRIARSGNQRPAQLHAGPIDGVAGGKVVAAVEHHIGIGDQRFQRFAGKPTADRRDPYLGIEGL